ncbi:MAG: outer membrane protein assembly factor BamD [Candidatus Omnitrophota bacterium]|nr:MAG: outer membrane protein assembly factor BamD [Candidatus Omnitrophota bacterium]
MKKTTIIFIFLLLSANFDAYAFWIWSPKTKKWKNPQYSALATPYLQYREALKHFENKDYKKAYKEFKKLLIHYPDAKKAAEAQYYLGLCLEELGKPYDAFLEYQKVIDSYPNSTHINEVVERQYHIGEHFLNRSPKRWLGVSYYDFVDHPAIEIFTRIVEKTPYSPYASKAQYKLGLLFLKLGRYEEARDAFQKVTDSYPDSQWAIPAKYQLAITIAKIFPGEDYDSSPIEEAQKRLDEFIQAHPDAEISSVAEEQLDTLRNKEAKKNFEIAEFYARQQKFNAARIYYEVVVKNYPESQYAQEAHSKLRELKDTQ